MDEVDVVAEEVDEGLGSGGDALFEEGSVVRDGVVEVTALRPISLPSLRYLLAEPFLPSPLVVLLGGRSTMGERSFEKPLIFHRSR